MKPRNHNAAALLCAIITGAALTGCAADTTSAPGPGAAGVTPPATVVLPGDATAYTTPGTPVYFDAPPYDSWEFAHTPNENLTVTPGKEEATQRTPPRAIAAVPGVYKVTLVNASTGTTWNVTISVTTSP